MKPSATKLVLTALADGPKTGPQLQEIVIECGTYATAVISEQRRLGNVTRIDGGPPGVIATYALTEAGKQKIGA
jgi:hypothetical protein